MLRGQTHLRLVEPAVLRQNAQVVAAVRELLELAEAGSLQGLTFIAKLGRRDHRAGLLGDYRESPQEALIAAIRLKEQLLDASE